MADYQLTATDIIVLRTADQMWIPADTTNTDYVAYLTWLQDGGVPDPYVVPLQINPALDAKPAKTAAEILGAT